MKSISIESYSREKKLPIEFLQELGVEEVSQGLLFNYKNIDGSVCYRKLRYNLFKQKGRAQFSYLKSSDQNLIPYCLQHLDLSSETVFLSEGETDTLTLRLLDLNVIGFPGANVVTREMIEVILNIPTVVVVVHNDEAGETFYKNIMATLKELNFVRNLIRISFSEFGNDANDCWRKMSSREEFKELIYRKVESAKAEANQTMGLIQEHATEARALTTKWPKTLVWNKFLLIGSEKGIYQITSREKNGKVVTEESAISNFTLIVEGQSVIRDEATKRIIERVFKIKAYGDSWHKEFEISQPKFSSPSKFQSEVEREIGTRAAVLHKDAFLMIKAMAMFHGTTNEKEFTPLSGFQSERYLLGKFEISKQGIRVIEDSVVQTSDIPTLRKLNFSKATVEEAKAIGKKYVEYSAAAYNEEALIGALIAPPLTVLKSSNWLTAQEVKIGIEFTGDQGAGKTDLHKTVRSFFIPNVTDDDLNKPSDTVASIEEIISEYSACGFIINDFKGATGSIPTKDYALKMQNWIDGAVYTKMRESKVHSSTPFKGLVSINGQERLSSYFSSLCSRCITFNISKGHSRESFQELVKLRPRLSCIFPHFIYYFFYTDSGVMFLENRFKYHLDIAQNRLAAEFAVDRIAKSWALAATAMDIFWYFAFDSLNDSKLVQYHSALSNIFIRQVSYVRESDIVFQLISSLVSGLKSGVLFVGKDRPYHCNAGAVSVGGSPDYDKSRIWINPTPLLSYSKQVKAFLEMSETSQSMITRELKARGLLLTTKSRSTSRNEQGGVMGWWLKLDKILELEKCLKELEGYYIPSLNEEFD